MNRSGAILLLVAVVAAEFAEAHAGLVSDAVSGSGFGGSISGSGESSGVSKSVGSGQGGSGVSSTGSGQGGSGVSSTGSGQGGSGVSSTGSGQGGSGVSSTGSGQGGSSVSSTGSGQGGSSVSSTGSGQGGSGVSSSVSGQGGSGVSSSVSGQGGSSASAGLTAACQKTSVQNFCIHLLQPQSGQFAGMDSNKMSLAAVHATLKTAEKANNFIAMEQANLKNIGPDEIKALGTCAAVLGPAIVALRDAVEMYYKVSNGMVLQTAHLVVDLMQKLNDLINGETACCDAMKKCDFKVSDEQKQMTDMVCKYVNEAAMAGRVTQAFLPKSS